jgi:hypothetical protein
MNWERWVLSVPFLFIGCWVTIFNDAIFLSPFVMLARGIKNFRTPSWVPLFGGGCLCIGMPIAPMKLLHPWALGTPRPPKDTRHTIRQKVSQTLGVRSFHRSVATAAGQEYSEKGLPVILQGSVMRDITEIGYAAGQ